MKLPRYLQIALLVTGALVLYSVVAEDADDSESISVVHPMVAVAEKEYSAKNSNESVSTTRKNGFVDLFPPGIKPAVVEKMKSTTAKQVARTSEIATPPLPFELVGAWWSGNQRSLILQQQDQQWIICRSCRAPKRVWMGMKLTEDWQLKSVSAHRLTFLWLPQMREQHLTLGDMNSEPTFPTLDDKNNAK